MPSATANDLTDLLEYVQGIFTVNWRESRKDELVAVAGNSQDGRRFIMVYDEAKEDILYGGSAPANDNYSLIDPEKAIEVYSKSYLGN